MRNSRSNTSSRSMMRLQNLWSRVAVALKQHGPRKLRATPYSPVPVPADVQIDLPDRDDDDGDRVDWKFIRKITDDQFCNLVVRLCRPGIEVPRSNVVFLERDQGAYHYIARVGIFRADHTLEDFIVRIPGHGGVGSWTQEDAHNLECEVETMRYVNEYTDLPAPQVFGYSVTRDNELGFPFILMAAKGIHSAYHLWYEQPFDDDTAWKSADEPSAEVEKKRFHFLRSLAKLMCSLQYVSFEKIGLPTKSDDSDGLIPTAHSYHCLSDKNVHEPTKRPTFATTQEYIQYGMEQCFGAAIEPPNYTTEEQNTTKIFKTIGTRKIMEIVFCHPVFNPEGDAPETFTLRHNDLDLQNILEDDNGYISGIIDWDGAFAAPRCVGAAAVPLFLNKDWLPSWAAAQHLPHTMAWNTEHYRQIYAAAIYEDNEELADAKYITKSPIYHAAIAAIYRNGGRVEDFTERILRKVPGLHLSPELVKIGLGKGWPACEEMLKREIHKILDPEIPKAEYLDSDSDEE